MDLAYAKKTLFYKNKPYTVISEFWYDVENDEEFHSPVSRNSSANGTKGKMKKIMPDIQENQLALEEGGGYLQEYRKKHADKEKEKGSKTIKK